MKSLENYNLMIYKKRKIEPLGSSILFHSSRYGIKDNQQQSQVKGTKMIEYMPR